MPVFLLPATSGSASAKGASAPASESSASESTSSPAESTEGSAVRPAAGAHHAKEKPEWKATANGIMPSCALSSAAKKDYQDNDKKY